MTTLLRLARADFLERVRRHGFPVTLAFTIYAAYLFVPPNHSVYATLRFGEYRGAYNSAWVGSLVAMLAATFLSLAGFYLVKNALERDRHSGVGAILAATPLGAARYLVAKMMSNLAVLGAMIVALMLAAAVMQLVRGESSRLDPAALAAPFLIVTLPTMALVAALGVAFEVVPFLRGGLGNVVYFIFWMSALSISATLGRSGLSDPTGVGTMLGQMRDAVVAAFPDYAGRHSMGFNFKERGVWELRTFVWEGLRWTPAIVASRLAWFAAAFAIVLLSTAVFDRFDARHAPRAAKRPRSAKAEPEAGAPAGEGALRDRPAAAPARVPVAAAVPISAGATRIGALALAELRLALKGVTRWWWLVTLGLIVAAALVPAAALRFVLPFALVWPLLLWSPLGTREALHRTEGLLFSTPRPVARLLAAQWLAGAAIAALVTGGALARYALAGEWAPLGGLLAGIAFVPALALACGTWTGSSRMFEILYLLLWYAGPLERVPIVDFSGGSPGMAAPTAAAAALLLTIALVGRRRRLQTC